MKPILLLLLGGYIPVIAKAQVPVENVYAQDLFYKKIPKISITALAGRVSK